MLLWSSFNDPIQSTLSVQAPSGRCHHGGKPLRPGPEGRVLDTVGGLPWSPGPQHNGEVIPFDLCFSPYQPIKWFSLKMVPRGETF